MSYLKNFTLLMVILLLFIVGISYGASLWYGRDYWAEFISNFSSTVLGIIVSAVVGYSLWISQQRIRNEYQRNQLLKDIELEVNENLKRLETLEAYLNGTRDNIKGSLRIQGLRTSIMKFSLNQANVVILQDPDLEDEVDWIVKQCEEFDHTLARGFEQFFSDLAIEMDTEAKAKLWSEISSHVEFIRILLTQLQERLQQDDVDKTE